MTFSLETTTASITIFVLVLARVAGMYSVLPVLGALNIPYQFRAFAAIASAFVIAPTAVLKAGPIAPQSLVDLGVLVGHEAAVGMLIGYGVNILFGGMQLAGQVISQTSGMSLADAFDPTLDTNVPIFSQLLDVTALAVFVTIGGHRDVIGALFLSFETIPPGQFGIGETALDSLLIVLQSSFLTGVRAAAPVMVTLLLSVLIVGLISRTLPQLNTISLGFGFNAMILLAALAFTLGSAVWAFQDEADSALRTMQGAFAVSEELND